MTSNATTDLRDLALQNACPTIAAPRFGKLPDMANGQRVIVAANGLFMQVKLDWLDCMLRLGDVPTAPPLPYGVIKEATQFAFGMIPVRLLQQFIERGRAGLPNEVAGGLIYSRTTGELRLEVFDAVRSSPGSIEYRMPPLEDDESIAVDLHTHGYDRAFWSSIDNRDDRGIKVAGVFGNLERDQPSAAFRLAINGYYRALRHPWEAKGGRSSVVPEAACDLEPRIYGAIMKWLRWK